MERPESWTWILLALIIAGVVAVYSQTLRFEFTNWDDGAYITENNDLDPLSWKEVVDQSGRSVNGNWHPLTMLSFAADLRMAGENARWSHGVNMVLHLVNSFLVFLFLRALTRAPLIAAGAALMFAVHPTHVESVAWVSARKDLLMLLFGLLMLLFYVRYVRTQGKRLLWCSFLLFLLSCLSKAMAVSLVPTLILIDHFLGRSLRSRSTWIEKIPFIAVAVVIGLVAVKAQQSAEGITQVPFSSFERAILAPANIAIYLGQQLVPIGIWAFHPYPEAGGIPGWYLAALAATLLLFAILIRSKVSGSLAFGLAFFIINIALVLQLVPVGAALRAERYTYLSGVGSVLALAAGITWVASLFPRAARPVMLLIAIGYAAGLTLTARERCSTWRNSITLWNDVLAHDTTMIAPYLNRGAAYYATRDLVRAKADYDAAIRIDPDHAEARSNRGLIFLQQGEYAQAAADFEIAAKNSAEPTLMANASFVLIRLGRFREALAYCDRAITLDPELPIAYGNRALCRIQLHDPTGAMEDATRFRAMDPSNPLSEQVMLHAWLAHGDTTVACEAMRLSKFIDAGSVAERGRLQKLACDPID